MVANSFCVGVYTPDAPFKVSGVAFQEDGIFAKVDVFVRFAKVLLQRFVKSTLRVENKTISKIN